MLCFRIGIIMAIPYMVVMSSKTATAQVRSDGRVTIPQSVRRQLGLQKDDFVVIDVSPVEEDENGG
jgi:DNA-binding transcriptional regulator/RsmH inhibitor MraZ